MGIPAAKLRIFLRARARAVGLQMLMNACGIHIFPLGDA